LEDAVGGDAHIAPQSFALYPAFADSPPGLSAGIDIYNDKFAVPIVSPFQFIFYTI